MREKHARTNDQFLHDFHESIIEAPRDNVVCSQTVLSEKIERDIDAALLEIAIYVLPEISEL